MLFGHFMFTLSFLMFRDVFQNYEFHFIFQELARAASVSTGSEFTRIVDFSGRGINAFTRVSATENCAASMLDIKLKVSKNSYCSCAIYMKTVVSPKRQVQKNL